MSEEKVEKITKVAGGIEETTNKKQIMVPDKERFDALMQQDTNNTNNIKIDETAADQTTKQTNLMDEISNSNNAAYYPEISPDKLIAQTQDVVSKIESIKQDLQTPNLQIKDSVQNLLKNKLEHIDDNLKIALEKVGRTEEYTPPTELNKIANPLERFLGFLTHSQHHLDTVGEEVRQMNLHKETITPGAMLALQIKVAFVSQELEFFTSLLNKALESTKTIMNVQV